LGLDVKRLIESLKDRASEVRLSVTDFGRMMAGFPVIPITPFPGGRCWTGLVTPRTVAVHQRSTGGRKLQRIPTYHLRIETRTTQTLRCFPNEHAPLPVYAGECAMVLRLEKDECLCSAALVPQGIPHLDRAESSTNPTWGKSYFRLATQIRQPQSIVPDVASASENKQQLASPNLFRFLFWRQKSQTHLPEQTTRFARIRDRHLRSSALQQLQMELESSTVESKAKKLEPRARLELATCRLRIALRPNEPNRPNGSLSKNSDLCSGGFAFFRSFSDGTSEER